MKKLLVPIVLFVAVLSSCGPKRDPNLTYFDAPEKYNDYIIDEQIAVFDAYDDFMDELGEGDNASIKASFETLKTTATTATDKMAKLADYKKNVEFRDSAKDLFGFYVAACDKELKELVDIFTKETEITDGDLDQIDKIASYMDGGEAEKNDKLLEAQKRFAKDFRLTLK